MEGSIERATDPSFDPSIPRSFSPNPGHGPSFAPTQSMPDLPPISGLSADIVAHSQWALRKWFYANPLWYYHRAGTDEQIIQNRKFYELVDPELRDLCKLLNDQGLHTTPSCQGHFYPRDRFERIWAQLTDEQEQIRAAGLEVKDSETQKRYLFQDSNYALPWKAFDQFFAQAAEHQGWGYLGILLPCDCDSVVDRLAPLQCESATISMNFDPQTGQQLGGRLFNILVRPQSPQQRGALWQDVTSRFEKILSSSACPAPFVPQSPPDPQLWAS